MSQDQLVSCNYWDDGLCKKGLFGGRPSIGVCVKICKEYTGSDKDKISDLQNKSLLSKTKTLTKAILFGKKVNDDRIQKRYKICQNCSKIKKDSDYLKCGICGCKVKGDRSIVNLTLYEETLDYGCKHPEGSQWKKNGV